MPLFRVLGIQLTVSWTWAVLLLLVAYGSVDLFARFLPGAPRPAVWGLAGLAALLAAASLYTHELAHALVARRFGIPVRSVGLFLLGGLTHMPHDPRTPKAEFWIALAGPLTSLAVGLLGALVYAAAQPFIPGVAALGFWLAATNVPLAIFNLVPAFPLDGGRVLRSILWFAGQDQRWASTLAARAGQAAAVALLFAGFYGLFSGTTRLMSGLWLLVVAWFLFSGASAAHHAAVLKEVLARLSVAAVMDRQPGRVDAASTLQRFAEQYVLGPPAPRHPRSFGVYRDDRLVGLIGLGGLRRIPAAQWGSVPVERVMVPLDARPRLDPQATALAALELLIAERVEQVPVVADERLVGVVGHGELEAAVAHHLRQRA